MEQVEEQDEFGLESLKLEERMGNMNQQRAEKELLEFSRMKTLKQSMTAREVVKEKKEEESEGLQSEELS